MSPTPESKQPKIIGYMAALYDKMSSEAVTSANPAVYDGQSALVWRGRLIETCTQIGIPKGYYKKVVDALRNLESIEIVERGSRGSNYTTIILHDPPTEEAYTERIVKSGWDGLTNRPSLDMLAGQIRDILTRLGGLNILEGFKNFEDRLQKLETAVRVLEKERIKSNKSNTTE